MSSPNSKECHLREDVHATLEQHVVGTGYGLKKVSWNDCDRGTDPETGKVSTLGANITDVRIHDKPGRALYTIRPDNVNERIGKVSADEIALVVPIQEDDQGVPTGLQPVTLSHVLKRAGKYGQYAGMDPDVNLFDGQLDHDVSVRFQTTFIPIEKEGDSVDFCTEHYNYNTLSDADPRNLIVVGTTQGTAFQQDGEGAKKVFHHSRELQPNGRVVVKQTWLNACPSQFRVGGAQEEGEEETVNAAKRRQATSSVIGVEAMGTRINAVVSVQIPLKKKERSKALHPLLWGGRLRGGGGSHRPIPICGKATAARISKGSEAGQFRGLTVKRPKRDPKQHISVTIVLYHTITGGVPSKSDVDAAIKEMDALYSSCSWQGCLEEGGAAFMTHDLEQADSDDFHTKVKEQPYESCMVANRHWFPRP